MNLVKEIARNVILIVFFASVLEMLLPPKSEMGKYIRLIMGLFVIISILGPVLSPLNENLAANVLAANYLGSNAKQQNAIEAGLVVKKENEELIAKIVQEKIKQQICTIAELVPGVHKAEADISFGHSFIQSGEIDSILITVFISEGEEENKIKKVQPVAIESGSTVDPNNIQNEAIRAKVHQTVTTFFDLAPEKIKIKLAQ